MRKWRRELHAWDPNNEQQVEELTAYLKKLQNPNVVNLDPPNAISSEDVEEDVEEDMRLWSLLEITV